MIPTLLLNQIDESIQRDQGAAFRGHLGRAVQELTDAFNPEEEVFRNHLGYSLLGRECEREIWYSWHWYKRPQFSARMLRLFNRGHLEEARFVAMLRTAGVEVFPHWNGKQIRATGFMEHAGGSTDGIIRGVPDIPASWMINEFKTHSEKSFKKLKDDGLMGAKWEHFVQMQLYMGHLNMPYGLYAAVNKNDDDVWMEVIPADPAIFSKYIERSKKLVLGFRAPPPQLHSNPKWSTCRYCDFVDICHRGAPYEKNCRTCKHGVILDAGKWGCEKDAVWGPVAPRAKQELMVGCNEWEAREC